MRWLLTTRTNANMAELRAALSSLACVVSDDAPIPLDGGEQVIEVVGPDDLPAKLPAASTAVTKVSPSSEMELY